MLVQFCFLPKKIQKAMRFFSPNSTNECVWVWTTAHSVAAVFVAKNTRRHMPRQAVCEWKGECRSGNLGESYPVLKYGQNLYTYTVHRQIIHCKFPNYWVRNKILLSGNHMCQKSFHVIFGKPMYLGKINRIFRSRNGMKAPQRGRSFFSHHSLHISYLQ